MVLENSDGELRWMEDGRLHDGDAASVDGPHGDVETSEGQRRVGVVKTVSRESSDCMTAVVESAAERIKILLTR